MDSELNNNVTADSLIITEENVAFVTFAMERSLHAAQVVAHIRGRMNPFEIATDYIDEMVVYVMFEHSIPLLQAKDLVTFGANVVSKLVVDTMEKLGMPSTDTKGKMLYQKSLERIWKTYASNIEDREYINGFQKYTKTTLMRLNNTNNEGPTLEATFESDYTENLPMVKGKRLLLVEQYRNSLNLHGLTTSHVLGGVAYYLSILEKSEKNDSLMREYLPFAVLLRELHLLPNTIQAEDERIFFFNSNLAFSRNTGSYYELLENGISSFTTLLESLSHDALLQSYDQYTKQDLDRINSDLTNGLFGNIDNRYQEQKRILGVVEHLQQNCHLLIEARKKSKNPMEWFPDDEENIRREKIQDALFLRICLDSKTVQPIMQILDKFQKENKENTFHHFLDSILGSQFDTLDEENINHAIREVSLYVEYMLNEYKSKNLFEIEKFASYGAFLTEALTEYIINGNTTTTDLLFNGRDKQFLKTVLSLLERDQPLMGTSFMTGQSYNCYNSLKKEKILFINLDMPLNHWHILLNSTFIAKRNSGQIYTHASLNRLLKEHVKPVSDDIMRSSNLLKTDDVLLYLIGSIQLAANLEAIDDSIPKESSEREDFLVYLFFSEVFQPSFKGIKQASNDAVLLNSFRERKSKQLTMNNYKKFIDAVKSNYYSKLKFSSLLSLVEEMYENDSDRLHALYGLYITYKREVYRYVSYP